MINYHKLTTQTELYEKVTEIISFIELNEQSLDAEKICEI